MDIWPNYQLKSRETLYEYEWDTLTNMFQIPKLQSRYN